MVSPVFEFVAGEIERRSALATLEARGTVRLALKRAGLESSSVTSAQSLRKNRPAEISGCDFITLFDLSEADRAILSQALR